jgi:hypothetical protein
VTRGALVSLLVLLAWAPAWADHGGELRSPGASPIVTALVWAGAALALGMAVIAIVTVLSRRRPDRMEGRRDVVRSPDDVGGQH